MLYRSKVAWLGALALGVLASSNLFAAEWGTLKGRFVYDGKPAEQAKLKVDKDVEVCAKDHPLDESLVVGKDGGLANVVLWVREQRGKKLPVHPSHKAADAVTVDNEHCRFTPHVTLLQVGQKLLLKNSDGVAHNSKIDCFVNPALNVLIPAGKTSEQKLHKAERLPVKIGCNIHPWMTGYLMVRDDPYAVASAEDGTFEIQNVPTGQHEFQVWQEKSGYLSGVTMGGKKVVKGRVKLTVKPGVNDLGDIKVPASVFKGK